MYDNGDQLNLMLGRRPSCSPFTEQRTAKEKIMTGLLSVFPCTGMQTNVRHLFQIRRVHCRAHCIPRHSMMAPNKGIVRNRFELSQICDHHETRRHGRHPQIAVLGPSLMTVCIAISIWRTCDPTHRRVYLPFPLPIQ